MDTSFIRDELVNDFGIGLDIQEKRFPDRDLIQVRPVDFPQRRGITIASQIHWLSLTTYLEFEDYSGGLLNSIVTNHRKKVEVMVDNLKLLTKKTKNHALKTNLDQLLTGRPEEIFDLKRLSISIHTPTMKKDKKSVEEYVVEHQKNILGIILLLFDLNENQITDATETESLPEGSKTRVEVNRYERSRLNRQACLNYHGYSCKVCNFNFGSRYGALGQNFIHVHHLVPVSEMGQDYQVNPIKELIPVCPNCHAMIHKRNPPLTLNELADQIR